MRIFLTGATGFIGSNLVKKLLLDEHEVVCFVRNIQKARKILGPNLQGVYWLATLHQLYTYLPLP
jgi:uncharacterized protein YbjT (DUF2867 family)